MLLTSLTIFSSLLAHGSCSGWSVGTKSIYAFLTVAFGIRLRNKAVRCRSKRRGHGCGCSSGVEHNLAKVGVEGSNPFARSKFPRGNQ